MAYYTKAQWYEMLQAKLGTHIGTDNKRFSPDRCDSALRQSIRMWQPLMPNGFQDNYTENVVTLTGVTPAGGVFEYPLPEDAARLMGIDISGYTVELYGIGRKGMDYNSWVDNKNSRSNLANGRVYLACYTGKKIVLAPVPTGTAPTISALVRNYPSWPTNTTEDIRVPETTIPFHLAQAASLGRWGDLKATEAVALQTEALTILRSVYAIQDREAEQS